MMMASDTVPAAVPSPGDPAGSTTATSPQPPQRLGGLLSAIDPPRPTGFTLNPTTDADAGEHALTGASSDDYHHTPDTNTGSKSTGTGNGRAQNSVWRAWLLAGAERWKKGADARNKALDIKKAKAQAVQVKESRTVNRSEKHVGGNTNTGTSANNNAGKSLNNKTSNTSKDPASKNSNGTNHAGRNGKDGKSGDDGNSKGTGRNSDSKPADDSKDTGKSSKTNDGRKDTKDPNGTKGGGSGPSGSSGAKGAGGSAGKDGKPGKDAPTRTHDTKASKDAKDTSGHGGTPDKARKVDLEKKPSNTADAKGKTTVDDKKTPDADTSKKPSTPTPATKTTTAAGTGKPLNVQESRETGYRDGVRAATVAAHVGAYRDGVRDGWADRKQDAAREKARLDQAHADHKQQPQQPTVKVPPMPTHAPTNTAPQPIPVTHVDATHIQLGDGASRTHISRGEVRTLAGFQRKLADKADVLNRIAERTKALEAHAKAQADRVTKLLEQARAVKGGEKLAAALAKLQEAAKLQEGQAAEVRKRAVRAQEACTTVSANADTRYGAIYKAVIDSPETAPAELSYYRDLGITNA